MTARSRELEQYFDDLAAEHTKDLLGAAGEKWRDEGEGGIVDQIRRAYAEAQAAASFEATADRADRELQSFEQFVMQQQLPALTDQFQSDIVTPLGNFTQPLSSPEPEPKVQSADAPPSSSTVFVSTPIAAPPEQPSEAAELPPAAPEAFEAPIQLRGPEVALESPSEPPVAIEQEPPEETASESFDIQQSQPESPVELPAPEVAEDPVETVAEEPFEQASVAVDELEVPEVNFEPEAGQAVADELPTEIEIRDAVEAASSEIQVENVAPDLEPVPEADPLASLSTVADTLTAGLDLSAPESPQPQPPAEPPQIIQEARAAAEAERTPQEIRRTSVANARANKEQRKTERAERKEKLELDKKQQQEQFRERQEVLTKQQRDQFMQNGGVDFVPPFAASGFNVGFSQPDMRPTVNEGNTSSQAAITARQMAVSAESLVSVLSSLAQSAVYLHQECNRINQILDRSFG